jgi:hypothetical protein
MLLTKNLSQIPLFRQNYPVMNSNYEYRDQKQDRIEYVEDPVSWILSGHATSVATHNVHRHFVGTPFMPQTSGRMTAHMHHVKRVFTAIT